MEGGKNHNNGVCETQFFSKSLGLASLFFM